MLQRIRNKYTGCGHNDIMETETCEGDLLAAEDAEVLTALASPPGKGRENPWSGVIHLSFERIKPFQTEKGKSLWITQRFDYCRNKHKIRSICVIFLVPRSDDTKDAQVLTSLRKRGRWHPGVITKIRMPSQESWELLGVQTSFFAIEYLLSRVVDVATLCSICSHSLSDRKMSKFIRDTETFNSWMNYKWAQKHLSNSLRTSCPTLSVLGWTIKWPAPLFDKWLWLEKCWNMNVISELFASLQ